MQPVAFFRARGNANAPLFQAFAEFDAEQMRKHPEYFECDAKGKALDGKSVAAELEPVAPEPEVVEVVEAEPAETPKSVFAPMTVKKPAKAKK